MSDISSDEDLDNGNKPPQNHASFIKITNEYMENANKELKEITKIKNIKEYKSKLRVLKNKYLFLSKHRIDKRTSQNKIFRMNYIDMIKELEMNEGYLPDGNLNPNYISSSQIKKITKYIQKKLGPRKFQRQKKRGADVSVGDLLSEV